MVELKLMINGIELTVGEAEDLYDELKDFFNSRQEEKPEVIEVPSFNVEPDSY